MRRVRINQGRAVPLAVRFLGTIIAIVVPVQIMGSAPAYLAIPLTILVSLGLPMLWFSFNVVTIDNDTKEIHQGIWIMGRRLGKPKKFGHIEKIFINRILTSQNMYSRAHHVYTAKGVEFKSFVKLDNGNKYFLTSQPTEEKAEEKVKMIRKKLGLI